MTKSGVSEAITGLVLAGGQHQTGDRLAHAAFEIGRAHV